jgi:hypothetical protein
MRSAQRCSVGFSHWLDAIVSDLPSAAYSNE